MVREEPISGCSRRQSQFTFGREKQHFINETTTVILMT
jgi:hypothetical protein